MARILFVDDEVNVLRGLERILRKQFDVSTASSGEEGLRILDEQGPFAVVVSDFRMPQMNGVQFLSKARELSPDSVRLLLTGQADMSATVDAINHSAIFRFLSKPLRHSDLVKTLESALEQYRLITAEKQLLEETLTCSVEAMSEVLGLVNPLAFSKASRLKHYVGTLVRGLGLSSGWEYELAATVSQIGCVALPQPTLERILAGQQVNPMEQEMFRRHPEVCQGLLEGIPRLEGVARMVGLQQHSAGELLEKQGLDAEDPVAIGAQLIRVGLAFDQFLAQGKTPQQAVQGLNADKDAYFPLLQRGFPFLQVIEAEETSTLVLPVAGLMAGMIFDEDVWALNGLLLVAKGQKVTRVVISRLQNFAQGVGVQEPIRVLGAEGVTDHEDETEPATTTGA